MIPSAPRRLAAAVDGRLFAPGRAHRLATVRAGLAVVMGLRLALGPYAGLAGQPGALFDPPALLAWLPRMPGRGVLVGLQVAGTAAALAVLAHRRPRAAFAVAWACLLVLAGLRGSLGKILHNDVLVLLAAVPLLAAPGGARRGDPDRSAAWGWPVRAATVVVAVAYFASGAQKLLRSGLDWVTGDNMRWIMYQAADQGLAPTRSLARAVADRPWLATAVAGAVLAVELAAPLALASRRARPWYALAAVALHLGTWLTLGLDYWGWALTVAVVLPAWGEGRAGRLAQTWVRLWAPTTARSSTPATSIDPAR